MRGSEDKKVLMTVCIVILLMYLEKCELQCLSFNISLVVYEDVPGKDPFLRVARVLVSRGNYNIYLKREDNNVK